jgi:AraC-like DNA-binding protein
MQKSYSKVLYDDLPGFRFHHTVGIEDGTSTMDHLHLSPWYLLMYFIDGEGNIKIKGEHYSIHPGDVFFITPEDLFHCSIDPGTSHERLTLHIQPNFPSNFPCDTHTLREQFFCKAACNYIPSTIAHGLQIDAIFTKLHNLMQHAGNSSAPLAVCKVIELMHAVIQANQAQPTTPNKQSPLIKQVLKYLESNITSPFDMQKVANHFNISQSHLSHVFKKHTGISLWNYVILQRINLFNRLISEGITAEEACYQAGFQNYSNFFRLYKRHMGITPKEYKHQIR